MSHSHILLDGDREVCWAGSNADQQILAYCCGFDPHRPASEIWESGADWFIAVHQFFPDGRHRSLHFEQVSSGPASSNRHKLVVNSVEKIIGKFENIRLGMIRVLPFEIPAPNPEFYNFSLKIIDGREARLLPRDIRFLQDDGGRPFFDLDLTDRQ